MNLKSFAEFAAGVESKFTVAAGTLQGAIEALRGLRCAGDKRRGKNRHYAMVDIGMAAGRCFFMQSLSLLAARGIAAARLWSLLHGACSDGLAS